MKKIKISLLLLLVLPVLLLAGCEETEVTPTNTIVDVASADARFSSLVAALDQAGLVSALQADGPLTVFAPTDEAFSAFLAANNFASLSDVPNDVLTQVLLNHVVSGSVKSTDLSTGYVATLAKEGTTDNPISLYVDLTSGVRLNGVSTVTQADVEADNGIIHVVNTVIGVPTVVTHALSNPEFLTLTAALTRSDLDTDYVSVLSGNGPFTVFAPTNAAFTALLNSNPAWTSLNDIPKETLEAVLQYHVVNGANVLSSTLTNGQEVSTLQGSKFTVNISGSSVSLTDANGGNSNVIATDVQGGNGVVHVIDAVILP
jgi:uncharacterized surface protein with fasciclin (FAS1) repeats